MADLTKIVPTTNTSSLTVSEVNGISLTKSKQNGETTLPTTSFAEILEAQLSQNNLQTEEIPTESKQILPGQSVDTSLFGSLIVVVRDVEVPINENQDTPTTNKNSRLFIPTVFTASTSSSVTVSQLPIQKPIVTDNIGESSNSKEVLSPNALKTSQNTPIEQQFAEATQTDPQNPTSISPNKEIPVSKSTEQVEDSQKNDFAVPIPSTLVLPINQVAVPQQIATNISSDSKIDKPLVSDGFIASQQKSDIPNNQTKVNTVNNVQSTENAVIPARTNPLQVEKTSTPPPIANVVETNENQKTEPVSTTKQVNDSSPRTLSSMLQSVQGLKMGIERTPTQQTFITVALPISEVQRLVVANPEVFTPKPQLDNVPTQNKTEVVSNVNVEPTSSKSSEVSGVTTKNEISSVTNPTIRNEQSVVTPTSTQNREALFVPTTFTAPNSTVEATTVDRLDTKTVIQSTKQPEISIPVTEENRTTLLIEKNLSQPNSPKEIEQNVIRPTNFVPTELPEVNATSVNPPEVRNVTSVPTENSKQQSFEAIATTIENFATNLQTINSPKVSSVVPNTSNATSTNIRTEVEFPFQAKIETISAKNTLVLEPIQKEILPKSNQKIDQPAEPKYTITNLLQKADDDGITIESIVVKIPVQSTKNVEIQKETVLASQQQSILSPLTKDIPKQRNVVATNETAEVSIPIVQSSPNRSTQNSKEIPSQTVQTPIQQANFATTVVGSHDSTSVIENQAVKQTVTQNEQTSSLNSTKEVAVQKTEPSSNTKQDNSNLPPRRDVSTILQRVENIQQKSTSLEVNNLTSPSNNTGTTANNVVSSPTVTTKLNVSETQQTIEVTPKQPITTKDTPIIEESTEKEFSSELVNNPTVGVSASIKSTTPFVSEIPTKEMKTPVSIEELPKAIVEELVTDTTPKGSKATFTLNPEQLGKVQVEIDMKGNSASITLESTQKETIPMLEKQLDTLKEQLKTSNIIVEKLEVLHKPAEIVQPTSTMNDTFTSSQQMEQQSSQQEVDRQAKQQRQQQNNQETEINPVEEIQPKRFGDGSSIIEEYI